MIRSKSKILLSCLCVCLLVFTGCKKGSEPVGKEKKEGAVVRQKVRVQHPAKAVKAPRPGQQEQQAGSRAAKEGGAGVPGKAGEQPEKAAASGGGNTVKQEASSPGGPAGKTAVSGAEEKRSASEPKTVEKAGQEPGREEAPAEPGTEKQGEVTGKEAPAAAPAPVAEEKAGAKVSTPSPDVAGQEAESKGAAGKEKEEVLQAGQNEEKETAVAVGEESGQVQAETGEKSGAVEDIKIDLGELAGNNKGEAGRKEEENALFNPFMPLFQKEAKNDMASVESPGRKRTFLTPLEKIGLSQLRLTGIIMAASGNRAIVEDSTGKGYVIRKGTYIGLNSGVVEKIAEDRVIVVETIGGRRAVTELKLQKSAGE